MRCLVATSESRAATDPQRPAGAHSPVCVFMRSLESMSESRAGMQGGRDASVASLARSALASWPGPIAASWRHVWSTSSLTGAGGFAFRLIDSRMDFLKIFSGSSLAVAGAVGSFDASPAHDRLAGSSLAPDMRDCKACARASAEDRKQLRSGVCGTPVVKRNNAGCSCWRVLAFNFDGMVLYRHFFLGEVDDSLIQQNEHTGGEGGTQHNNLDMRESDVTAI